METSTYESESPPSETNVSSSPTSERPTAWARTDATERDRGPVSESSAVVVGQRAFHQIADRHVVGLAVRQSGQLRQSDDGDRGASKTESFHDLVTYGVGVTISFHGDDQLVIVACGGNGTINSVSEETFDRVEADAEPEELQETALPSGDLEETGVVSDGEVAGVQHVDVEAGRQLGPTRGVTHHHVRSAVEQLAVIGQLELTAGDRPADGSRIFDRHVRREVGHAGGGLRCPVHDDEFETLLLTESGVSLDGLCRELAACLRDVAQRWDVLGREVDPIEQIEGEGNRGERGHVVIGDQRPEARVHDRTIGHHDRSAAQQVRVQHRQSVAVVERERQQCAIGRVDRQVVGDRFGVRLQVGAAESNELRHTGRARRRQQHGEFGMKIVDRLVV